MYAQILKPNPIREKKSKIPSVVIVKATHRNANEYSKRGRLLSKIHSILVFFLEAYRACTTATTVVSTPILAWTTHACIASITSTVIVWAQRCVELTSLS
jgi:hypothetical protein